MIRQENNQKMARQILLCHAYPFTVLRSFVKHFSNRLLCGNVVHLGDRIGWGVNDPAPVCWLKKHGTALIPIQRRLVKTSSCWRAQFLFRLLDLGVQVREPLVGTSSCEDGIYLYPKSCKLNHKPFQSKRLIPKNSRPRTLFGWIDDKLGWSQCIIITYTLTQKTLVRIANDKAPVFVSNKIFLRLESCLVSSLHSPRLYSNATDCRSLTGHNGSRNSYSVWNARA